MSTLTVKLIYAPNKKRSSFYYKLNSLYKVRCVITDIEVSVDTGVVDSDIPLLLSKDSMKRTGTGLNFENDSVTMFKKENFIEKYIVWTLPYHQTFNGQKYFSLKNLLWQQVRKKFKLLQSYLDNLVILIVRNYLI